LSRIVIIGAGFSGLSAAAYLSKQGYDVHLFEKNATAGGRARQLITDNGYVFDMGPSWYWMPGVFEKFFNDFGYKANDFYHLEILDPAFEIVFGESDTMTVPSAFEDLCKLFESIEPGSSPRLRQFMQEAEKKYRLGIDNLVFKPGISITEFANADVIKEAFRLQIFSSFSKHVRKFFNHPKLIALMEFPILFLGATAKKTPSLYSLMNYAGLKLGTWYPKGGFGRVVEAMVQVAKENGATFHYCSTVEKILTGNNLVTGIKVNGENFYCDAIIASSDYHHTEQQLLLTNQRNYSEEYWSRKTFAPSCLIFYLGVNKKLEKLQHHTLFFDEDLTEHSKEIYEMPQWPKKPLFYCCCPSRTDESIAPPGHENIFLLMPIAPGLKDTEEIREKYFDLLISRLQNHVQENILDHIDFKKSYCITDFVADYNSYKGNAYGLANTLTQTAILKPKIKNKKLKNLFYAGQLTVPGPGVPPSIISGRIAADQLIKQLKKKRYEVVV
jgi:phytoene desaturase